MSVFVFLPLLLGILAGLLVNYLADVLPISLRLNRPVCANTDCQKPIAWIDYLLMRSCRNCGRKVRWRTGVVLVFCVISALYIWFSHPARLGFYFSYIFLIYLYLIALIDLEHRLILRPLSIVGLILAAIGGTILSGWSLTLIGGLAGFAIMYFLYLFGKLFTFLRARRMGQDPKGMEEALGSGDVTLAAILGLFLGWPLVWFGLILGVLLAGLLSLIIILVMVFARKYKQQAFMIFIPFGPAFVASTILLIYLPNWINTVLPG